MTETKKLPEDVLVVNDGSASTARLIEVLSARGTTVYTVAPNDLTAEGDNVVSAIYGGGNVIQKEVPRELLATLPTVAAPASKLNRKARRRQAVLARRRP